MTPDSQTRNSMLNRIRAQLDTEPPSPRRRKLKLAFYALGYGASLPATNRIVKRIERNHR